MFGLSTRSRYAARAVLDLAAHWPKGVMPLKEIAQRQGVSKRYLEQLMRPLQAARIVRAVRGPEGGYALAKPPSEISLAEIVTLLEGPMTLCDCVEDKGVCERADICRLRDVWSEASAELSRILKNHTFDDLCKPAKKSKTSQQKVTVQSV